LVLPTATPALALGDTSAAAVIRGWSAQLATGPNLYKEVVITATQGGGNGGPGALYVGTTLKRNSDGSLTTQVAKVLYSDRKAILVSRPIQPFDAAQADTSQFTFTLTGYLIERSHTWGFTQTIPLASIGNQMVAGWGASIGNSGPPSYWAIGVTPQNYVSPT
jgi:TRAP-type mannitol/chloroaromatic compound transport system substrate-binding protein